MSFVLRDLLQKRKYIPMSTLELRVKDWRHWDVHLIFVVFFFGHVLVKNIITLHLHRAFPLQSTSTPFPVLSAEWLVYWWILFSGTTFWRDSLWSPMIISHRSARAKVRKLDDEFLTPSASYISSSQSPERDVPESDGIWIHYTVAGRWRTCHG